QLAGEAKSVVVLEARDRVGGRTKPGMLAGHRIDLGGMWVGPTQTRIVALGDEYGVRRYVTPAVGDRVSVIDGDARVGKSPFDDSTHSEFVALYQRINELSATVPPETPWTAPNADVLDSKTFRTWIEEQTENAALRSNLDRLATAMITTESASISMLYLLFYVRSGDDLGTLTGLGEGAQKWLYHGGVHQIAEGIAKELGERVVLDCPVHHIRQDAGGVEIVAEQGIWKAKQVIVALPPAMCARIRFSPVLPPARDKLQQRYPMGSAIKFWAAYKRPFWRERGLSGYAYFDKSDVTNAIDATPHGAREGLLAGFIEAGRAIQWSGADIKARRTLVLGELARAFGPEALEAIDYVDNDWSVEEWSHGCYGGNATPGTLTMLGTALRKPVGRVHWAGTETSPIWAGYIDGAVRAGERAATEAAAAL
ncbi:MAG: FAD-dependent oxidoreductase, partial [Sphingopyxis sp.]|nr:FAD-dependent oxidoreductase [Sphingopyxis sp.]